MGAHEKIESRLTLRRERRYSYSTSRKLFKVLLRRGKRVPHQSRLTLIVGREASDEQTPENMGEGTTGGDKGERQPE